jgi:hypothetical protein
VRRKIRPWQFILLVALVCGISIWAVVWYRGRTLSPTALLRRMPVDDALVVYLDVEALRQAGILQMFDGSKTTQEPEYQSFVQRTGFDYREDLDSVLLASGPTGNYFFVCGRFDWKSLRAYVEAEAGHCYNSFCKVAGSTPERHISFFPVQTGLMAMAVSTDDSAAWRLSEKSGRQPDTPTAPVWISIPPRLLQSGGNLPAGTAMFARAMERAESVTLALGPDREQFAARLDVRCRNSRDAAEIAAQLAKVTAVLRQMIEHEHKQPNPSDLSGPLAAGSFRSEGERVYGYWPVQRGLLESLLGGA